MARIRFRTMNVVYNSCVPYYFKALYLDLLYQRRRKHFVISIMKSTGIVRICILIAINFDQNKATYQLSTSQNTAIYGEDFSFICTIGNAVTEFRQGTEPVCIISGITSQPDRTCQISGTYNTNYTYTCNSSTYTLTIPGSFLTDDLHKSKWKCKNFYVDSQTSGEKELIINVPITMVTLSNSPEEDNPVKVIEGRLKEFICKTDAGRPPPRIQWYISSVNITSSATSESMESDGKTISSSHFIYTGKTADSGKFLYCTALNLEGYRVRSMNKTIDILYSPSAPSITQKPKAPVDENTKITLTCEIKGGNPLANITWQCNGSTPVDSSEMNNASISLVELIATRENNGKVCNCIGSHPTWPQTNFSSLVLDIRYAPAMPLIRQIPIGPVIEGSKVNLTCEISGGNPLANISWTCDGITNITPTSSLFTDKVFSRIEIDVTRDSDGEECICRGQHPLWADTKYERHTIMVYYSPEKSPKITQNPKGSVVEGTQITLTCEVPGGKPLAVITWKCAGVSTVDPPTEKSISIVRLNVSKDQNGEECTCFGSHPVWTQNKSFSIILNVTYPPESVAPIKQIPSGPIIENNTVTLTCEISGGNPLASIAWQCDGFTTITPTGILPTDKVVSSIKKTVTKNDNGKTCTCKGLHHLWTPAEQMSHVLNIYYSSTISISSTQLNQVIENRTLVLVCTEIDGNPRNASFVWYKGNTVIGNTSNYSIRKAKAENAGNYTCKGSNGFGTQSTAIIKVYVLYSPRVSALSAPYGSTIPENGTAVLQCTVQSNPSPNMKWMKQGSNDVLHSNGNVFQGNLTIENANCLDTSNYTCKAMNIINGDKYTTMKDIQLLISCSPRRYNQHEESTNPIGLAVGQNLTISEHILAYPIFNITWVFKHDINSSETTMQSASDCSTYTIFDHHICFSRPNLTENDFGLYSAVIVNDIGYAKLTYTVNPQEKPYKSSNVNATCGIVQAEVSWITGYNGGQEQRFYIITTDKDGVELMYSTGLVGNAKGVKRRHSFTMPEGPFTFSVFGNNTFGNATAAGPSCDVQGLEEKDSVIGLAAGLGSSMAVILIIIMSIIIVCRKRTDKKHGDDARFFKRSEKKTSEDDDDELKDNPLYVTSNINSAISVYSTVDKTKKTGADFSDSFQVRQQGPVYSEVKKNEKKGNHSRDIEMGNVYGNAGIIPQDNTEEGVYANAESKSYSTNITRNICIPKKNKDGLIYADLELNPTPSGKKFVIRGLENRTNYAIIDLNIKVDPLLSDDDDDDDDEDQERKMDKNLKNQDGVE